MRVPEDATTRALLARIGVPIAAPSANLSTHPSATDATMVLDDFAGVIPYVFDGGSSRYGIESTVVRVEDGTVYILRPGMVTREDIVALVPTGTPVVYTETAAAEAPRSPGTKYRHYAPHASIGLLGTLDSETLAAEIRTYGRVAILATEEYLRAHTEILGACATDTVVRERLGSRDHPIETSYRLYWLYREMDRREIPRVLIEPLPEDGIGYAIMNRIRKSIHP